MNKLMKILFLSIITIFLIGNCFCAVAATTSPSGATPGAATSPSAVTTPSPDTTTPPSGATTSSPSKKNDTKKNGTKTIVIKKADAKTTLYFSGTINPHKKFAVTSPVEGVITEKFFDFGQDMKKGDKLFIIKSSKQQADYQEALVDYLKAKQTLQNSEAKYKTSKKLNEKGVMSDDDYKTDKNAYLLDRLAFVQAQAKVTTIIGKDGRLKDIDKLTLENIGDVSAKLELEKKAQDIMIIAPIGGIALKISEGEQKIDLGSDVKTDQVLLYLGSKDQLSTNIKISEINVNQLHIGQPAIMTGDAFPDQLKGYIEKLAAQATTNGGQPTFSAQIVVPQLTSQQVKNIKMGMSVKVAIPIVKKAQIMIPIVAINPDDQTVQVVNPTTNQITKVKVETGETTFDDIIITSGLKEGDHILVPNSNK
jgi:multidrug efflux pump subunit AcrA (membrane-fusion protein)